MNYKIDKEIFERTFMFDIFGFGILISILLMLPIKTEVEAIMTGTFIITSIIMFSIGEIIKVYIIENRKLRGEIK